MNHNADREFDVRISEASQDGLRLVTVIRDGREVTERVRLEDAYERVHFAGRALRALGVDVSRERLAEFDARLIVASQSLDRRPALAGGPRILRFSDLKSEKASWLWPRRIARGAITLLAGDPGLGKSLVALDIAARVSRGGDWPDSERGSGRSESVVLLSGEDHLQQTIVPRLKAMGADTSQLVTVEPRRERWCGENPPPFALDRDMDDLRQTVDGLGNCAFVVLDPISAFLGRAGECSNWDVRQLLAPLAELAVRRDVAVLLVAHLRKDMGPAVRRALGSMAFMAVSRAAWLVLRDPARPERRLMLPVKNNLATDADGLAYEVVESLPETLSGKPQGLEEGAGIAVVKWSAERLRMHAEEAISESRRAVTKPNRERRQAVGWLREFLSCGPRRTVEVREQAEAHGLAFATLKRAFWELGGVARKDPTSRHGAWTWQLPVVGQEVEEAGAGVEERSGGGADEAGSEVEQRSRGVAEESGLPTESEAKVDDSASDVGGGALDALEAGGGEYEGGELEGLLPSAASMKREEEQLRAALEKASEESAAVIEGLMASYAEEVRLRQGG